MMAIAKSPTEGHKRRWQKGLLWFEAPGRGSRVSLAEGLPHVGLVCSGLTAPRAATSREIGARLRATLKKFDFVFPQKIEDISRRYNLRQSGIVIENAPRA